MFMFVAYPWPVPSANIEPPGPSTAVAATETAGTPAESSTLRGSQVEQMVGWTCRERLRFRWYGLRLTTNGIRHHSRRAREPRLKLP
jgi:hypothetical protein